MTHPRLPRLQRHPAFYAPPTPLLPRLILWTWAGLGLVALVLVADGLVDLVRGFFA